MVDVSNSNADSVVKDTVSGRSSFVKPLEAEEPFSEFLNYVRRQEKCQMMGQAHVKYAQTRMLINHVASL